MGDSKLMFRHGSLFVYNQKPSPFRVKKHIVPGLRQKLVFAKGCFCVPPRKSLCRFHNNDQFKQDTVNGRRQFLVRTQPQAPRQTTSRLTYAECVRRCTAVVVSVGQLYENSLHYVIKKLDAALCRCDFKLEHSMQHWTRQRGEKVHQSQEFTTAVIDLE